MKKSVRWAILFGILSIVITVFIFENSLQTRAISRVRSGFFVELLRPLLELFPGIPPRLYSRVIRKTAHFAEFAALGFCLTGFFFAFPGKKRQIRFLLPPAASLLAAVADESIQRLSDRSAAAADVLLDCSGALCGVLLALACRKLRIWYRRRHRSAAPDTNK